MHRSTDVRVLEVSLSTGDYRYRTPLKFGGMALDRVTTLQACVALEDRRGRRISGQSSMPLGNVWAFPSRELSYDQTLQAMKSMAAEAAGLYQLSMIFGHPIEITWQLESELLKQAPAVAAGMGLSVPIPPLATLVAASPIDAALHDAYGKLHGLNCYATYSAPFLDPDLSRFFGREFAGVRIDHALNRDPVPDLPLYHLVGALDPLLSADVTQPVGDGLPESLLDWTLSDGLTHLKIKLNGDDLEWDIARVLGVNRVADEAGSARAFGGWQFSLDFNERCQDVEYLLEFLERLQVLSPTAIQRIAYIEQPTARDLAVNRHKRIHAASRILPVVIDESLIDLESLYLAREMGYTGVALKACKGQSQTLLLAAAARHLGMSLCVQDLTCPGASLIHSAGLAAHVRGVGAIEANSRQYCPAGNEGWEKRFPGIFTIRGGVMHTGQLTGLGLGAS